MSAFMGRVRAAVTWNRVFGATSYVKSALWIVPIVAIAIDIVVAPVLRALDAWLEWDLTSLDVEGATALFQTVITLTLSFMVFTFGSLLVAIQIASGQLTPRIIATTLLRDNVVRYSVGLFVFTLVLTVMTLNRMHQHVNQVAALAIILLGIANMATFLFLIDYAARLLRPVSIVRRVGENGLKVIEERYPDRGLDGDDPDAPGDLGTARRVVMHEGLSRVVVALDVAALLAEARRRGGVVELAPQIGDFLAYGEPLFYLYRGAADIGDEILESAVALGAERTLEQDPMFAFRILVDIALKALSPAINDPTTAVLAMDQVHRLLRIVGQRRLHSDAIRDDDGTVRVIIRTPAWEDFVHVSCVEVRACGAHSVQIARRLRAMLEDLLRLLPAYRHPALREQLDLLDRAIEPLYPLAADLALARGSDVQGLGGSPRLSARDSR
jgi:uncharacterized membrane protein